MPFANQRHFSGPEKGYVRAEFYHSARATYLPPSKKSCVRKRLATGILPLI